MITGYDVSKHQGTVSHQAFKDAGYRFCMIKCSEGTGYRDPAYLRNVEGCLAAGLDFGSYHFARISLANTDPKDVKRLRKTDPQEFQKRLLADASAEAHSHFEFLDGRQNLPSVVDVEWDKRVAAGIVAADTVKWVRTWIDTARSLTARMPLIYTGRAFWRYKLGRSLALTDSPLWQADYRSHQRPKAIDGWPAAVWQNTGSHPRPDKPRGKIDHNIWMGSEAEYADLADGTDLVAELPAEITEVRQPAWAEAIIAAMQRFAKSHRLDEAASERAA